MSRLCNKVNFSSYNHAKKTYEGLEMYLRALLTLALASRYSHFATGRNCAPIHIRQETGCTLQSRSGSDSEKSTTSAGSRPRTYSL
jgi:hypothetical protein